MLKDACSWGESPRRRWRRFARLRKQDQPRVWNAPTPDGIRAFFCLIVSEDRLAPVCGAAVTRNPARKPRAFALGMGR